MPDIFGKEQEDYQTLTVLREARGEEFVQAHMQQRAQRANVPAHDFNAFGSHSGQMLSEADEGNAQAIAYVYNNLTAIQQMSDEILYRRTRFQDMLPVNENIPAGADSYGVRITDRVGQGAFIEARGSNAPSANAMQRLVTYPLRYGGIVPQWSFKEIRSAMVGGFPLAMEVLRAGIMGAVNHIEQVAFFGDEESGIDGLLNHSQIPVTAATGTFASRTGQELVDDLFDAVNKFISDSKEIISDNLQDGFCIYLPTQQGGLVTSKRLADGNDRTVWSYFLENNFWMRKTGNQVMLKTLPELSDAAANKTDDRMLIGLGMNDLVLELGMPLAPRVLHVLEQAYGVIAPIEYEVAPGVSMKRPSALRYYDGI